LLKKDRRGGVEVREEDQDEKNSTQISASTEKSTTFSPSESPTSTSWRGAVATRTGCGFATWNGTTETGDADLLRHSRGCGYGCDYA
jgi:hypothetical protein